ncbi:MAG: FAD-binding oxidoreductase [Cyanothece sp. SIO2G6]|nr:FAD-binding oxidoreductase [Cyanothece sp. SIO2G6]
MVYDWIVIGNGIAGAAASYELAHLGLSVLLVERHEHLQGATRHSYGSIPHWAATTPIQQQLCEEGMARYRQFSDELGMDTTFREQDLLLTVPVDANPEAIAQSFSPCLISPQLISQDTACEMEPLLNPEAIAAALTIRHGHVNPEKMVQAYNHGFQNAGGKLHIDQVTALKQKGDRVIGITTTTDSFHCDNVLVCTGGWTRHFLNFWGIPVEQYFTHSESIECPNPGIQLNTFVMSAITLRFALETNASRPEHQTSWNSPGLEIMPPVLDAGALQFSDGQIRMGQISRVLTDPSAVIDADQSETNIRTQVSTLLPCLKTVVGHWHHCLVAFSRDNLPLIGPLQPLQGLYLFSGFHHPFVFVPPLAQRFAAHVSGPPDPFIQQMNPHRFSPESI